MSVLELVTDLKKQDQPQCNAHIRLTIAAAIFEATKMAASALQRKPGPPEYLHK